MTETRKKYAYLIFLVIIMVAGIAISVWGYGLSSQYNNPTILVSELNSTGLVMSYSNRGNATVGNVTLPAIKDVNLGLYVNPQTDEISINVSFYWFSPENHTFGVIIPTYLKNYTFESSASEIVLGNFSQVSFENVTGQQSSILSFTFTPTSPRENYIYENYYVDGFAVGNLVNNEKGQLEFYLPIGQFPKGNVSTAYYDTEKMPWFPTSYYNVSAIIAIPSNAPIQSAYPSFAVLTEPSVHPEVKWLIWTFTTPAIPISVNYINNVEVAHFQNDLFFGGILIGIGLSMFFACGVEIARLRIMEWKEEIPEFWRYLADGDYTLRETEDKLSDKDDARIDKILNEDLKGILTDDDIRFVIQNRIDLRKFTFGDYLSLGISFTALFTSFILLLTIKGVNPLTIIFLAILILALALALIAASNFRRDNDILLNKYVKSRQKKASSNSPKP